MKFTKLHLLLSMALILCQWLVPLQSWSQCTNTSPFGSAAAPTSPTAVTISSCTFAGEYNTITGATAGSTYVFTGSGGTGNFLTVRQGTSGGTVLASGLSPVTATCTVSGSLFLHVNTTASPACGTDLSCHTTTVACSSCATFDPCASAPTSITCGSSQSATISGSGAWNVTSCGFSTPGQERLYTFTPTVTGNHTLNVTAATGGYIDYFFKPVSSGCNATGWTCIDDLNFTASVSFGPLTAGTPYYILLDPESTSSVTHTFNVSCPAAPFDPCAAAPVSLTCGASTSYTSTGTGAWSPPSTSCGFSTPGQEKLFTFTPSVTGSHILNVTAATGGFVDYFFKPVSGGCNSTGWTCIDDVNAAVSTSFGPLTAGTQYYILADPEVTTAVSQSFSVTCPSAVPFCVSSPTAPANGATGICPSNPITLSWPSSAGATSYDVYFGTTASPAFLLNTASTTTTLAGQPAGLKYWQVVPRSSGGAATGCAVWTFTVNDATPPTITCPGNVTVNNAAGLCGNTVTYGAVTATDACGAPSITLLSGQASGTFFPVGINTVVYRATDGSGNTATCSFQVRVNDTQLPTITCPANIAAANDPNACSAVRTFATPTASDNCSATVAQVSGLPSGSAFPVGTTVNVFRATDPSGNSSTCSFSVVISDTQAPSITCPSNKIKNNDAGDCGGTFGTAALGTPVVLDNCGINSVVNTSPGFFGIGTTTITYTVADPAGNTKSCVQTVTVLDSEYPSIACPSNMSFQSASGVCSAVVDYEATATDNCAGVAVQYSIAPNSDFQIGLTAVTATATDAAGNKVSCNFNISVAAAAEVCNGVDDDCDGLDDEADDWDRSIKRGTKSLFANERFGRSVDIDGDWGIVGSKRLTTNGVDSGAAYIVLRDALGTNKWGSVALLQPNLQNGDNFGASVAISQLGYAAVGAPGDGTDGAVYVYELATNGAWMMVKKIVASDPDNSDNFGAAVSMHKDRLVVGAPGTTAQNGDAYVFDRNAGGAGNWGEVAALADPAGFAGDQFGLSVAVDSNYVLVGAPGDDQNGSNAGAAHRYKPAANGFTHTELLANNGAADDHFGHAVATGNGYAYVGAPGSDLYGIDAGTAYSFRPNGTQYGIKDAFLKPGSHYGYDIDADGDYLIITAPLDSATFASFSAARGYIYATNSQGTFSMSTISFPTASRFIRSNSVAAISGRSVILGAEYDDLITAANSNGHGSISVFDGLCWENRPAFTAQEIAARNGGEGVGLKTAVRCTPVPFRETLNIDVDAKEAGDVNVNIFNSLGAEVARFEQVNAQGNTRFTWNAANQNAGVYFVKVRLGTELVTKVITLVK